MQPALQKKEYWISLKTSDRQCAMQLISTGLLFTVILLLMCWAIFKGLRAEVR